MTLVAASMTKARFALLKFSGPFAPLRLWSPTTAA